MNNNYKISLAKREDVNSMLNIYAPFILNTAVSFESTIPSEIEFWARVKKVLAEAPWLVCKNNNNVIAYAYASEHRSRAAYQWSRELSVYVHKDWSRKGIAMALYHSLIELLKLQGYRNTFIGITLPNIASVKFHEKMGYQSVGIYHKVGFKNGQYHDVGWWEMLINDANPETIKTPEDLKKNTTWDKAMTSGLSRIKM